MTGSNGMIMAATALHEGRRLTSSLLASAVQPTRLHNHNIFRLFPNYNWKVEFLEEAFIISPLRIKGFH
jgi:hypothetical protein